MDSNRLDAVARACIACGLCLPHCATYLAGGDERQSPRGRILLLHDLLKDPDREPDPETLRAFDLCLGCRACETHCPSGVHHALLDAARELGAEPGRTPAWITPERLPLLGRLGGLGEGVFRFLAGPDWRRRLDAAPAPLADAARRVGSRPTAPGDTELIRRLDALCGRRTPPGARPRLDRTTSAGAVTLFRGCANAGLLADSQRRLVALLETVGERVEIPTDQDCCGAFDTHAGRSAAAAARRCRAVAAVDESRARTGVLLVEAAGCGLELLEQAALPGPVVDAVVHLDALGLSGFGAVPLRVTYHDPCHALHGRSIAAEPRRLLDAVPGVRRLEPEEAAVCCGSGGPYALRHPAFSAEMGRRKTAHLFETGAQLILTSNPGCLGQIRYGLLLAAPELPILPLTDFLWYAALRV